MFIKAKRMKFGEVIGQDEICKHLLSQVKENRVPHAQLLCGAEGCGKFAIALAYATYLLCSNPSNEDSCGVCPSCTKMKILEHPDFHFIFPTIKKLTCDSLFKKWKDMILTSPYFSLGTWLAAMDAGNQQPTIYQQESDIIQQRLLLTSSEGGRKIVIIWLPERMNASMSNKMLKILEEPPADTIFLLVSEEPDLLIRTVLSRVQRIDIPPISQADMKRALCELNGLSDEDATSIARLTRGNYVEALRTIRINQDAKLFFDEFVLLMRMAYVRNVKELLEWSEQLASWGREKQKNFLEYSQRMIRENFIYNFHRSELNYMSAEECNFALRFARFINEKNVIDIAEELEKAHRDITQNANARLIFFDLALKITVLIRR